jgi:gliding motility-associated lipoprotein GldH
MPSPYYQKEEGVPQNAWQWQFQPVFKINIPDTTSRYSTYFVVRHTDAYPYSNIWMWVYTKKPGDSVFNRMRVNIQLAESSGHWLGRGMGEIWEQYMPVTLGNNEKIFTRPGTYEVKFEQNMRVNPLPEILHIGLRVEKLNKS